MKNSRNREIRELVMHEQLLYSSDYEWFPGCTLKTVLKIQRSANAKIVFTLSGRIEAEDVAELRRLLALETANRLLALDLRDVTLVHREAVRFLAKCEADSVELENCPAYIREWMKRESGRTRRKH